MKKTIRKKRIISLMLALVICFSSVIIMQPEKAQAASKYITVKSFIKSLVISLDLSLPEDFPEPYIAAAVSAGILKSVDFGNDFDGYITRTDAAVLLNRADEYLHGDTVDAELLQVVLEERISDIKKVAESKRESVAKCFAKGIIKGYSNGSYSQDREFRGTGKVTESAAKTLINLVLNPKKRAKISPDGQLIRTTNLPKYAKYYPYILASFPNQYYDWMFSYEGQNRTNPETGEADPYVKYEEYAAPIDIDKTTYFDNFTEVKDKYLNVWVDKVKTYMECVFNVDYRTINDEWINKILSADYSYGHDNIAAQTKDEIEQYIENMKENKTIVESSKIAVDGSSLYFSGGHYILRVYAKYKIVSSKIEYGADADTLINENPYGKILYTSYPLVNLNSYTLGEWKEGYFDVELSCYFMKEPDNIGVLFAILNEVYYEKRRVDK